MGRKTVFIMAWALLLLSTWIGETAVAQGATLYVATTGSDSGGCTDPNNPCRTVQYAVDQSSVGDEIRVASGNYTDLHVTGGMTAVVQIDKSITIRGGYTTTNWATPYPSTNLTIIDPQEQGRGVIIAPGITVTMEGLQITNGKADKWGGGILAKTGAQVTINRCWIYNNQADQESGGIHIYNGTLTLTNSYIYGNTAGHDGGGVNFSHSSGTLRGNVIHNNTAVLYNGGGVYLNNATNVVLQENYIYNNTAGYSGGGVYLWTSSDAVLKSNYIHTNECTGYNGGGVYMVHSSDVELYGNHIYGNAAPYRGGGIALDDSNNVTMTNNLLADNQLTNASGSAAGIYLTSSNAHLLHNTIARNTGGNGEGIYAINNSTLLMTNTILVGHTVGITVTSGSTATIEATLWGSGPWANGDNTSGDGTITTTNDVSGAPAFVDPDNGDYHISRNSAAIDAGVDAGVTKDIDGDSRPQGAGYDLGADEYSTAVAPVAVPTMTEWGMMIFIFLAGLGSVYYLRRRA